MKDLKGKNALLTGASRGIGVYIATALADRGVNLALVARSVEGLENVKQDVETRGVKAVALPADVGKLDGLSNLVKQATETLGPLDLLVNNAALESTGTYHELTPDEVDRVIVVNLLAPMHLTRLVMPEMIARGRGHILNVASLAGLGGMAYGEPYSTSKHGLVGFSNSLRKTIRVEGYPLGVSVVCPGFISETGMYADSVDESGVTAPDSLGTSSPETVAAACVEAVERNRAVVIVNPKPIRPLQLINLFSPETADWLLEKMGLFAWCRDVTAARKAARAEERTQPKGVPIATSLQGA